MSNRAWMPLHIDDYLADTGHLTGAEHGGYLLLIMHYWQNGGLPDNERLIARIARMDANQWAESRDILSMLFGPNWTHKRIDAELAKAEEVIEKRRNAANKRHADKNHASAVHVHSKCSDTGALPLTSNQDNYTAKRASDISERMPELYAALGVSDETKVPGLLTISEPIRWVNAGCDIDADILPALRSISARGKSVKTWGYCADAIFEARDKRIAPPPPMQQRSTSPPKPKSIGEMFVEDFKKLREAGNAEPNHQRPERLGEGDGSAEGSGSGVTRRFAITGNELGRF